VFDLIAINGSVFGSGQLVNEFDQSRFFVPGYMITHKLNETPGIQFVSVPANTYCFDAFSKLGITDPDDAGLGHFRMLENDLFHLGREHILSAGLNQLLFRFAALENQMSIFIDLSQVAGVVPAVTKGIGIDLILIPIAQKDQWTLDYDFSCFSSRQLIAGLILNANVG
jgi:hypothetical protein